MNTDACNVEDINVLQIVERLWMSCNATFEEWSSIFRNRSFTLCKRDCDFSERFDGVKVHVIIDETNLSSSGPPRTCLLDIYSAQRFLIFIFGILRTF